MNARVVRQKAQIFVCLYRIFTVVVNRQAVCWLIATPAVLGVRTERYVGQKAA